MLYYVEAMRGRTHFVCIVDNKAVIIIKGSFDVNGKMATDIISYGYAAIVLAGGVVGYVKAGKGPRERLVACTLCE